jgi:hypothetical protein
MSWLLKAIQALLGLVLGYLTKEQLKEFADMAFDFVEDAVAKSENPYDDAVVLPIIKKIRDAFDIPDNDDDLPDA